MDLVFFDNFLNSILDAGLEEEILHFKPNRKLSKPPDCPVCFESLENQKIPLQCGHWIHDNCISISIKHGMWQCPICRRPVVQNPQVIKQWLQDQLEQEPQLKQLLSIVLFGVYMMIYFCRRVL